MRYWRYSDGAAKAEMTSSGGAWLTKGDQIFYALAFGGGVDDVGWLGMAYFQVAPDTLEVKAGAAFGLGLGAGKAARFKQVTGEAAVFPGKASDFTNVLRVLEATVDGVIRHAFVGAGSKEVLIRDALKAFQARDVPALMNLSYPTSGPYMKEERLHTYLTYQLLYAGRGIPKFEEAGREGAGYVAQEKFSKQADIGFPAPIEAEGWFKATKTITNGTLTGTETSHIFYGRVGNRWAILGSQLMLKELPPPAGRN